MDVKTFENIQSMKDYFNFSLDGEILESDISECENETDLNERKLRDAEVLTTLSRNLNGDCLEIGTSHGRGAYKLATNTKGTVFTVNALPEQLSGKFVTHALNKEQIGSYLREKGIKNFVQIYANSLSWNTHTYVPNVSLIFIDGCHDTEYVYQDSRLAVGSLRIGGFMVWHDFNPDLRKKFPWINSSMMGAEKFCAEYDTKSVYHLKDSWMGFWKKF